MLESLKLYRKVALVSGLSAAGVGAAALFAYRFYATRGTLDPARWSLWLSPYEVFSTSRWLRYFTLLPSTNSAENESEQQRQAQQQETDRLARHYDTTVAAADEYNSELLEIVATKIFEIDGLEALLTSEAIAQEGQETIANKVKTISFVRFIASIWIVPLTFLLCRLMFCIYGRVVYLSNVASAIHTTRSAAYIGSATMMQCPPLFDASYQRRLLRTFKSITPDAICRVFFTIISQVVAKHVEQVNYDEETSEQHMYALLSTVNSELEVKITSHNGDFWKSLLGKQDIVANEEYGYVNDVIREARKLVGSRIWHVLVVDSVKWIVRQQTSFLKETYKSVVDEIKVPETSEADEEDEDVYSEDDPYEDDDDEEEGSDVDAESRMFTASGKLPGDCTGQDTVLYDENGSQASDKSAYDITRTPSAFYAPSRDARRLSPDPRFDSCPDPSRLVAEGSLEPLVLCDGDEAMMYDANTFAAKDDSVNYDSEKDTGDHHSVRSTPLQMKRSASVSKGIGASSPPPPPQPATSFPSSRQMKVKGVIAPALEVNGIPFVRWATKLGKRGKDIFMEETETVEELKSFLASQNFFVDVFASESVTTLPRCQEEAAPRFYNRS